MVQLTHVISPDDVERHVAHALGDGEPPIGRYQEAWHILRADDALPALILFRHVVVSLDDLYRLCNLMLTARICNGYLVYVESDMPPAIIEAARKIGIVEHELDKRTGGPP